MWFGCGRMTGPGQVEGLVAGEPRPLGQPAVGAVGQRTLRQPAPQGRQEAAGQDRTPTGQLAFTQFYRVSHVLPGFTGFYWVLLGFTCCSLLLLGSTGFYWVLPGFTGFYRV